MTIVYRIAEFNIFLAGMEDNGTLGWLIEFGLIKQNQRTEQSKQIKVPNFSSSKNSTGRRSFDEQRACSTICGNLGLYIRSTIDGQHYVTSVNPGSPAEHAGIRVYDKIIQINSISTDSLQNHQVLKLLCSAPEIDMLVEGDEA